MGGPAEDARKTASGGPTTKTISSITDSSEKAARSSPGSVIRYAQRARTIGPMLGWKPPPTAAATSRLHSGAWPTDSATSVSVPSAASTTWTGATLLWPRWSTMRASCGCRAAAESENVAETRPALAYCPLAAETSRTIAMPSIEIGSRARNPAAENRGLPGTSSNATMGLGTLRR